MKKFVLKSIILGVSLFVTCNTIAQTVIVGEPVTSKYWWYSIAYIDSNHPVISLSLDTPSAGTPVQSTPNSDVFLKISVYEFTWYGNYRGYISASISGGSLPPGTMLTAVSAPCTVTNSGGILGTPVTPPVSLTTSNQRIVNNIGTCYTGSGDTDGYQITFELKPSNYGQIIAGTYNVTVMFTVSP